MNDENYTSYKQENIYDYLKLYIGLQKKKKDKK